jgi:hypothetical protein
MKMPRTASVSFWMASEQRKRCLWTILTASLWLSGAAKGIADNGPQPILRIDLTQTNQAQMSQNGGTPPFYSTPEGQLVLIRGRPDASNLSLASDDQGRTWHTWDAYGTWPKMYYQDVVRRGNELLAFGLDNGNPYTGTHVWWSSDEGRTWAGGNRLTPDTDPWTPMINRVLLTSTSRVIVPIEQLLGAEGPDPAQVGTIYSDDAGRSWTRSPIFGPPPGYPTAPEGISEPAVVELANGKTWMVCRALGGHLMESWSDDGGATWDILSQMPLTSPLSTANAKRIPGTNAVILIWNNAEPTSFGSYTPRSPLSYVISEDNCQTWNEPVVIDSGTATYPGIYFLGDRMYVDYWRDPNGGMGLSNDSHLMLVAYDIAALHAPEPSVLMMAATGVFGLFLYAWRTWR